MKLEIFFEMFKNWRRNFDFICHIPCHLVIVHWNIISKLTPEPFSDATNKVSRISLCGVTLFDGDGTSIKSSTTEIKSSLPLILFLKGFNSKANIHCRQSMTSICLHQTGKGNTRKNEVIKLINNRSDIWLNVTFQLHNVLSSVYDIKSILRPITPHTYTTYDRNHYYNILCGFNSFVQMSSFRLPWCLYINRNRRQLHFWSTGKPSDDWHLSNEGTPKNFAVPFEIVSRILKPYSRLDKET